MLKRRHPSLQGVVDSSSWSRTGPVGPFLHSETRNMCRNIYLSLHRRTISLNKQTSYGKNTTFLISDTPHINKTSPWLYFSSGVWPSIALFPPNKKSCLLKKKLSENCQFILFPTLWRNANGIISTFFTKTFLLQC